MSIKVSKLQELARDTRGAGFVEYIILVGLIAIVGIAAYRAFGSAVATQVNNQATQVQGI